MKLLLIARHYPPLVSGGARRPFLLAEALAAEGVEVAVTAPALPAGAAGVIAPHPTPDPPTSAASAETAAPSIRGVLRSQLMLPDPDIRWALRASRAAVDFGRAFRPDWIMTTSPPESVHVAGRIVAARLGARWVADFRDHWLAAPLLDVRRRRGRRRIEAAIALRLLRRADLVIAPTDGILRELRVYGAQRLLLTPQPAPPAPARSTRARNDGAFEFLHTGSFSLSHAERRIDAALDFLAAVRAHEPSATLRLIGRLTDDEAAAARAAPEVVVDGLRDLEASWRAQREAGALLLVAAPGAHATPGKLAEYRASGRPIVCLGDGPWRRGVPEWRDDPVARALDLIRGDGAADETDGAAAMRRHDPSEAARALLAAMAAEA